NPAEAEACFRQAVAVARRHQAKSLELRATTSLARLWQRQGRRDEARAALAAVYDTFTEGFTTPDPRDAPAELHGLLLCRHRASQPEGTQKPTNAPDAQQNRFHRHFDPPSSPSNPGQASELSGRGDELCWCASRSDHLRALPGARPGVRAAFVNVRPGGPV